MIACPINRTTVANGIVNEVKSRIDSSNLFTEQNEIYYPIDEQSDYQDVVNKINVSFGEEIIMPLGYENGFVIVDPSDGLVNGYLPKIDNEVAYSPTSEDITFASPKPEQEFTIRDTDSMDGSSPETRTTPVIPQSEQQVEYERLTEEEDKEFKRLQKLGLISKDSITVNGNTYYKIPEWDGQRNEEAKDRLENIINNQGLDFVHVIYGSDNYLVQLGKATYVPSDIDSPTLSSKASSITKTRVLRFLDNIGFRNIQTVSDLVYKGERLPHNAYIDFLNGVMQIREGHEDYTLPEEAMTILVELVKQSRPELYERMYKEVINYQLYRDVVNDKAYDNDLYKLIDGTKDYSKIRNEAITKVLAEYLINQLEGTRESALRIHAIYTWWQQIINWIKELFGLHKNPFEEALAQLNEDDTTFGEFADISSDDIFLSAKSIDQIDKENPDTKKMMEDIKRVPVERNIYKIDSDYYENGKKVPDSQRVTALKDKFYEELFGERNLDPESLAYRDQSAKEGFYLHQIFEETARANTDPETGLMRKNPAPVSYPLPGNPIQGKIVSQVQSYVRRMMASYPQGTRFLIEQIVYDPNAENLDKSIGRFGTIDFMAIIPAIEGKPIKVDIIDWKSTLIKDEFGIKDYKKRGYFIQLDEYKRIMEDAYGVKSFGKIRAIPITWNAKVVDKVRMLLSINIADPDAAKIPRDQRFLRPIISPLESTGSEERDILISKLEALYQKYVDAGYFRDNRTILNDIQDAIYEIRVSDAVSNLANYLIDTREKFRIFLDRVEMVSKGDKDDINEALALTKFYLDIIENVVEPSSVLIDDTSIDAKQRARLAGVVGQMTLFKKRFINAREDLLGALAEKFGIFDLMKPEKVANLFRRWFRSMGSQDIATVRFMYELVKKSYNRIDFASNDELNKLKQYKYDFEQWRKERGLSTDEAVGMIVDYSKGRLHSKLSSGFFDKREEVLHSKNAKTILSFVKDNYNMDDYYAWYKKTFEENKKMWSNTIYDPENKERNAAIIKRNIITFQKTYDIEKYPISAFGYHNPRVWSKNIKEEKWLSDKFIELSKPENTILLDIYNFFVEKNKQLADTGAIDQWEAYTFLPNVRKRFADIFSFSDKSTLEKVRELSIKWYRDWRASISVQDYQLNYHGAVDPFSGESLNKRFVPYINYIPHGEKSFDIFTIYGLMTKEIHKERYLSENDEIIRSLVELEKLKPTLAENQWGRLIVDPVTGKPEKSKQLGRNAAITEEHMRAIVNGELLQVESDFVFKVQLKLRQRWNNSWLGKLYKFDVTNYKPTNISTVKFIHWANNANMRRILGVNLNSALSNIFGGAFSSTKLYEKYASTEDIKKAFFQITSGAFYSTDEMKKRAALVDYFLPLLNNRESFKSSQLSVNKAATILSQEWLMSPMRKGSEIVQLNIFLAVMENTGIIDGKLINLREKATLDSNYNGRYADGVTPQQRKEIETKFKQLLKEYKTNYAILKHAQFKTIKEAGKDKVIVDLPQIDRNSYDVERMREIIQTMSKDSLGEADEFDMANYKYSLWWRLVMTFKNWIPRMADVRFGEFRYSQSHHAYEYGRFRMFVRAFTANYLQTAAKLVPIPYLTGKVTSVIFTKEALVERAKKVYAEKVAQAKFLGKYDEKTFISQGEFVDRYIKGTEATFAELRTLAFMGALIFMGLMAPDPDDTPEDKSFKTLARMQIRYWMQEIGFFYSLASAVQMFNNLAPITSFVRDGWLLMHDLGNQFFGFTLEEIGLETKGLKMEEKAKPIKRIFKIVPVLKEILKYLPAIDAQTAKEWGVTISDNRNF